MTKVDFAIGQNSLEVSQQIVKSQDISHVSLISHTVGRNWRQEHSTPESQAANFRSGLTHLAPLRWEWIPRGRFLEFALDDLDHLSPGQVWSMTSHVQCGDGKSRHIPMMNFHPVGIGRREIKEAILTLCGAIDGVILDTGRFSHYYGDDLLEKDDWVRWMAGFLGPCVLVSPRYIGHRLHHGYASLRLTDDEDYKPVIPTVIEVL